jgi:hypothetical protein
MNRLIAIISITTLLLISCGEKENVVEVPVPTNCPPSAPAGVYSINLDSTVVICWYANPEDDVKGYDVYRGVSFYGDYDYIGTVEANSSGADQYCYEDISTDAGLQYYYAVVAYDEKGLESDLSYEEVSGTPRPEGEVTLSDVNTLPLQSGFDLSGVSGQAQPATLRSTDFYFERDGEISLLKVPPELQSGREILIQDYGYVGSFDGINYAPEHGWSSAGSVEAIIGHIYILRLHEADGYHYAKLYVTETPGNFVALTWAYQSAPDNRDLAPPYPGRGAGGHFSENRNDAQPGLSMEAAELAIDSAIPPIVERVTWTRDFEFGQRTTI